MNKRLMGSEKEQEAKVFLEQNGYLILDKNFKCRTGEIDLVARDGEYLCFIEVKYRNSTALGYPEEAVNLKKQNRIIKTAFYYLMIKSLPLDTPCRFDVVVMLKNEIDIIKNAFETASYD